MYKIKIIINWLYEYTWSEFSYNSNRSRVIQPTNPSQFHFSQRKSLEKWNDGNRSHFVCFDISTRVYFSGRQDERKQSKQLSRKTPTIVKSNLFRSHQVQSGRNGWWRRSKGVSLGDRLRANMVISKPWVVPLNQHLNICFVSFQGGNQRGRWRSGRKCHCGDYSKSQA